MLGTEFLGGLGVGDCSNRRSPQPIRAAARDTQYIETCGFCRPEAKPGDASD
ncbi:hypothetical protein [Streptomyces fagopyri]|uniref:hypothetical protein n=1 Tax=Streptomyces fagopyri TaxID=2662397 RepID=UPI001885A5A2|nr:hypothetical protein [Streptomyces fagopyri]